MCLTTKIIKKWFFRFFTSVGQRIKCTTLRGIESQIFAFRGSDPPLRLCCEFGHEVVGNLDLLEFFLDFFTEFKTNHLSHSDKSSGDRLKGAIETWNWKESTLIMGREVLMNSVNQLTRVGEPFLRFHVCV